MGKNACVAATVAVFLGVGAYYYFGANTEDISGNLDCVTQTQVTSTQDTYMAGIIDPGQQFEVLLNFYECNKIQPGDIVWLQISSSIPPVPRWVKAVPGDEFQVTPLTGSDGKWQLTINGQHVKVGSKKYFINSSNIPPLKVYAESLGGTLPHSKYILLSNVVPGMTDSSNLGVIDQSKIKGIVRIK